MRIIISFPENPEHIFSLTLALLKIELMMTGLRLKLFDSISEHRAAGCAAVRRAASTLRWG